MYGWGKNRGHITTGRKNKENFFGHVVSQGSAAPFAGWTGTHQEGAAPRRPHRAAGAGHGRAGPGCGAAQASAIRVAAPLVEHDGPRRLTRVYLLRVRHLPHPAGDVLLFGPHGIGVDRCGRELLVPEPLLHQVERDPRADRRHSEAVPRYCQVNL